MKFIEEIHNKKTLAQRYGLTRKQLYRKINIMLSDNEIKEKFGKYSSPFSVKQLSIIAENIGVPPKKEDQ